jgi:tetratricopeptide (TPR) repeat protein
VTRRLFIGLGICVALGVAVALGVTFVRVSARHVARQLAVARQARSAGREREAAEHYERYRAVAGSDADPDALVERAMVALRLASLPDAPPRVAKHAVNAAFEAIRRRPDDIRLRRDLADVQLSSGDFSGAREHLLAIRESIAAGHGDVDAAATDLALARTWLGTGDHREALSIVAALTGFDLETRTFDERPPEVVPAAGAYLMLATILREQLDDGASADDAVERCVEAHPDDPAALVAYSRLTSVRSEPEAALDAATRAVALAPGDSAAVLTHAQALAATGDHKAACAAYVDGVRRMPLDRPLFAAAARQVAWYGESEQILEILDGCWERLGHQEYAVLVFLASMRIDWKARPAFAERLAKARETFGPDNPAVIVLESRVRAAEGAWAVADKALVKARAIVPKESKSRMDELLARCLLALGEPDEAIIIYQRLERESSKWWGAASGLAEAQFDLGHAEAAAQFVDKLCRRWVGGKMAENAGARSWLVAPTLSPTIRVMGSRPGDRQDWAVLESMIEALAASPQGASDSRIAAARAELLAARGEYDRALASVPPATEASPGPQFDPLRLALIGQRDGIDAMRAALAALPKWRRSADVLVAAGRAEAAHASGDDRAWLRSCAAATDAVGSPTEAVQVLQELARLARAAGWADEARALWQRAATRLPDDFRPHLAEVMAAAGEGDAEGAAAAASRIVSIEGPASPRGRVALAAAIVAAVRGEGGTRPAQPAAAEQARARRLEEAKLLLRQAGNDRGRWQPVDVLLADIDALEGNWMAAAGHLERAVDHGPSDPRLVLDCASALDRCRRHADAERYRDSVAPAGVGGGDRLAIDASIRREDFRSAAARSLAAIDVDTADPPTLLWLSRLCSRAGQRERASELAAKAARLDPANAEGWLTLATCRLEDSDQAEADGVLAEGWDAVPPEQRRLLQARGNAVVGRAEEAELGFRELVEGGDDVSAAAYFVDYLLQCGRRKDAQKLLSDLISSRWGERFAVRQWATARLGTLADDQ